MQRSSTSSIVSIRSLGSGSFATVDLVSMPVGAERKLLVRKMLLAGDQYVEDLTGTAVQTASSSQVSCQGSYYPAGSAMNRYA